MTDEQLQDNHRKVNELCKVDIMLYGCAAILKNDDGTFTHIPAEKLRFHQETNFEKLVPFPLPL